uniref:Roadblock/LAMTOR2 domain-containing protein n=1 Tax=Tetraselmis chuii TaxID=63592 RepID=A0A7S1SNA2_9CHLO|mmetsp:Transcript_19588/g.34958  ORF Transcript_19588/g.34958 Transcript_19588/m.34958 type:complete len:147 (+) Transcript_19588:232-672(+)
MFRCCFVGRRLSKSVAALVTGKLEQLQSFLPGLATFALLDNNSQLLLYCGHEQEHPGGQHSVEERLPNIEALRRAASSLGAALGGHSCPIVHVKGLQSLCSCFSLGEAVLVALVAASPQAVELLDLSGLEAQLAPTLLQIRELLEL